MTRKTRFTKLGLRVRCLWLQGYLSNFDQSDPGIVKRNTSPHRVEHASILEVWVYPHGGISVDSCCPPRVSLDELPVNRHIGCTSRPMAMAEGKGDDSGHDCLRDFNFPDHRFFYSVFH